jgi:hypothetical protein
VISLNIIDFLFGPKVNNRALAVRSADWRSCREPKLDKITGSFAEPYNSIREHSRNRNISYWANLPASPTSRSVFAAAVYAMKSLDNIGFVPPKPAKTH